MGGEGAVSGHHWHMNWVTASGKKMAYARREPAELAEELWRMARALESDEWIVYSGALGAEGGERIVKVVLEEDER